ncbi:UNVERIFIED_CONTAM: hypothetical protein RF648_20325 [Kocuria sp. CPCC 205274]
MTAVFTADVGRDLLRGPCEQRAIKLFDHAPINMVTVHQARTFFFDLLQQATCNGREPTVDESAAMEVYRQVEHYCLSVINCHRRPEEAEQCRL